VLAALASLEYRSDRTGIDLPLLQKARPALLLNREAERCE
jgi:hypothetical protein